MDFASFLIQTLNSLQYGLLLFLVASGLTLVFGIMGIINLAHGSFYMIGAYLAFVLASLTGNLRPSRWASRWRCCSGPSSNGRCSPTSTSATTWSRCCSPTA
jgi:branched-subunit amino acid ABC-type transport system permease component